MHNSTRKPTRSASHTFAAALSGIIKPTHAASHALTAPLEGTLTEPHTHAQHHSQAHQVTAQLTLSHTGRAVAFTMGVT